MNANTLRRLAGLLLGAALTPAAFAAPPQDLVIRVASEASIKEICARYGVTVVADLAERGLYRVRMNSDLHDVVAVIMDGDPAIESAEPDSTAEIVSGHTQSFFFRVNAEYFNQSAVALLDISPALPDGVGTTVAILDTGISPNSAISAAILAGYNFVDDNQDTNDFGPGIDSSLNGVIDEMAGHGTFIAGLVSLTAPHCSLLPVKVLDSDGQGTVFTVAAGIYYAVDHGADVINLSLSLPNSSSVVAEAINYARAHGVVIVASVGNDDSPVPVYPAADPGVIAVAATTLADDKAWFSDYGHHVSICAPGDGVVSTLPDDMFGVGSGASFATAWVSGAAAVLKSSGMTNPTPDHVAQRLMNTAINTQATMIDYPGLLGSGRLSIGSAIAGSHAGSAQVHK